MARSSFLSFVEKQSKTKTKYGLLQAVCESSALHYISTTPPPNKMHASSSSTQTLASNSSSGSVNALPRKATHPPVRVAFVGSGAVGKYSAASQLFYHYFPREYNPSLERCLEKRFILRTKGKGRRKVPRVKANVQAMVCSGQDEFSVFRGQWIDDNEALIIMYDVTNRASFDDLLAWRRTILERMGIETDVAVKEMQRREGMPKDECKTDGKAYFKKALILVGNKTDLVERGVRRRQVSYVEGKRFAQKFYDFTQPAIEYCSDEAGDGDEDEDDNDELGIPFVECSVKDDRSAVEHIFHATVVRALDNREHNEAVAAEERGRQRHAHIQSLLTTSTRAKNTAEFELVEQVSRIKT